MRRWIRWSPASLSRHGRLFKPIWRLFSLSTHPGSEPEEGREQEVLISPHPPVLPVVLSEEEREELEAERSRLHKKRGWGRHPFPTEAVASAPPNFEPDEAFGHDFSKSKRRERCRSRSGH